LVFCGAVDGLLLACAGVGVRLGVGFEAEVCGVSVRGAGAAFRGALDPQAEPARRRAATHAVLAILLTGVITVEIPLSVGTLRPP
jgi:hypothetical protein